MSEEITGTGAQGGFDRDLEARFVALLMGEASAFEEEALQRLLDESPEARSLKRRLEVMHGLMGKAVRPDDDADWKLAPGRRVTLMKTLGIASGGKKPDGNGEAEEVVERRIRKASRTVLWMAAACVMINVILIVLLLGHMGWKKGGVDLRSESIVTYSADSSAPPAEELEADAHFSRFRGREMAPQAPPPAPGKYAGRNVKGKEEKAQRVETRTKAVVADRSPETEEGALASAMAKLSEKLGPDLDGADDPFAGKAIHDDEAGADPFASPEPVKKPSSAMAKVIASDRPSSTAIPVPDIAVSDPSIDLGEGDSFGAGWGSGGGGGFGNGVLPPRDQASPRPVQRITGMIAESSRNKEEKAKSEARDLWGRDGGGLGGGVIAREMPRRNGLNQVREAEELLHEGREAYAKGDYEKAVRKYTASLDKLPGGAATEERRRVVGAHLADGSVALAQQDRRTGRHQEARESLERSLMVDPANQAARRELEYLDDPVRTHPALDYEHTKKVDEVRRNLYTAEGYTNLGRYDEAKEEYQKALRLDPNNTAARRGMEEISHLKSLYYRSAYEQTRAELLEQVDAAWEMAVPPAQDGRGTGADVIGGKLKEIVIPEIDFENTTVEEAVDFLRQRTRELDRMEIDPAKKGMNFVIRKPRFDGGEDLDTELDAEAGLGAADPGEARVKNLKLKNVTVDEALRAIADQSGMRYKVDDYAVTMLPKGGSEGEDIVTQSWRIPPTFLMDLESGGDGGADPFADDGLELGGNALRARRSVEEILKESGVEFPEGTEARYLPGSSTLIVRNTRTNLDLVDRMTESLVAESPPVSIDPNLFKRRGSGEGRGQDRTWSKLSRTIIPALDLEETTVDEAVDFLRFKIRELEPLTPDFEEKGVDFVIRKPGLGSEWDAELDLGPRDSGVARVKELKLRNVPADVALQYICDQAKLRYKISADGTVVLLPLSAEEGEDLVLRSWEVHPDLMKTLYDYPKDDAFIDDGLLTEHQWEEARQRWMDRPLSEIFQQAGIDLPDGASAHYSPQTRVLIMRNTPINLELVDRLFEALAADMTQEKVEEESEETRASEEPFSTFSLHVSDVSFKLAKTMLAQGEWPQAGQIRVEEFGNAFDYGDVAPSMVEKVACRMDQAVHPFMQQRNVLRISMRTAALGRAGGTPLRLTVLLDRSGSMERWDRAEAVRRAFHLLAAQLSGQDQVTLIGFARTPRLLADRLPGNRAAELSQLVDATPSEGGTNLEEALRLGFAKAREQKQEGAQNRVILLTDGAANLGNARPDDLARLVKEMRGEGIAFDACGVGAEGLNDEILESLTRKGDGRYYFLDRPEDADAGFAKQIAGALRPAAKNVKVQVIFNPRRVGRYKLYGFEKHRLEKEDFHNDSVDAAEMAAEESGNAVYHFEVLPQGEGEVGTVSVRFQDMATGRMVERKWIIPYEPDAPRLDEAAAPVRLAASAVFLGEKLNGSIIGERVRLRELSPIVEGLRDVYRGSARVRELAEMVRQAREVEGDGR